MDAVTVRRELDALLRVGIGMTDQRLSRAPDDTVLPMIRSQLLAVQQDVARGSTPDPDLVERVKFGWIAVRQFEDVDPEYADVLTRASYLYKRQLAAAGPPR